MRAKCIVCVVAYAGLGTVLGLRKPEICGATVGLPEFWQLLFAGFGVALAIAGLFAGPRRLQTATPISNGRAPAVFSNISAR